MTAELKVEAQVNVAGQQAAAELKKLIGNVVDTKTALNDAKAASTAAAAALKGVDRAAADAGARTADLSTALRAARIAEIEAGAAAVAAARDLERLRTNSIAASAGLTRVGVSAGQARASTAQLGQQIGDISQGLAAGENPATIFAQQAGQVAFALSGMGGALGTVGTFLSGPFGAALLGATVIVGALASAHGKASSAVDGHTAAEKALKSVLDDLDSASGRLNKSTEESIRLGGIAAEDALKQAGAQRTKLQALLEVARAEVQGRLRQAADPNNANEAGVNIAGGLAGVASSQVTSLTADLAINAAKQLEINAQLLGGKYKTAVIAATAATDGKAKANLEFERTETRVKAAVLAGALSQLDAEQKLVAAIKTRDAAIDASQFATRASRKAQSEHNKELREAARDAKAYGKELESLVAFASKGVREGLKAGDLDPFKAGGFKLARGENGGFDEQLREKDHQESGMAALVKDAESRLPQVGAEVAKGFHDEALTGAIAIGQAIGGKAGSVLATAAGLLKGGQTGDFTGAGGPLGGILTLLGGGKKDKYSQSSPFSDGFDKTFTKPIQSLSDTLTNTFGGAGRKFAGLVGKAAGGAATGTLVSGIGDALGIKNSKAGAQIGGAIGGLIPGLGPFGGIIGSVLGGLVGGLFGPKGSTTISASGGKISSSGTGNAAIQKATGAVGNSVTDALQAIADQLGGSIGNFSVSIGKKKGQFRVDNTGKGKLNGSTVTGTDSESEALSLALAAALKQGAVATSPRVQAALLKYADNVNKAVAEALKVKGLEDLLTDRNNPFISAFRSLETQLKQRVDVARQYGFNLVQIEKINGEDRAKAVKDTLAQATGSVRALLTDLTVGSKATGAPAERLAKLAAERDRLTGLARGGDNGQLDAIANIVSQIDDLQKATFGSTAPFAAGRADSVSLLNDLVKQTEDRIKAAADQAKAATETTNTKLAEANASLDDLVKLGQTTNGHLAALIAAGRVAGVGGAIAFNLAAGAARQ